MSTLGRNRLPQCIGILAVIAWLGGHPADAQNPGLNSTFGSVTLKADFRPDPHEKKLTAGGPILTNLGGVKAYVEKAPDYKLFYESGKFPLTIYVESNAATTLLVNLPDGKWVAAASDPQKGIKPMLEFAKPQPGRYDIWVGTIGKELAAATLKITEVKVAGQKKTPEEDPLREWYRAADQLRSNGELKQALPLYEKALAEAFRIRGEGSPLHANIVDDLARALRDMGQYEKSEALLQRNLEIHKKKYGEDHLDTSVSMNNLANLYATIGLYAKAETLYRRSLEISEARKDDVGVASSLNNLALLLKEMGQYARADRLFHRCLDLRETKLGKGHLATAVPLNNLGLLYHNMGQYAKAEDFFRRSLEIREANSNKDERAIAQITNNLANLYSDTKEYARAEQMYLRCLDFHEKKLGADHPDTAVIVRNLGVLYSHMKQFAKAETLYVHSLKINEARRGDHPETAASLESLAVLFNDLGKFAQAQPLLRRSLDIREAKLGKSHPSTAITLNNLACNLAGQKEWAKAVETMQKAQRANAEYLGEILPVLSEKEQLNLLEVDFANGFHHALSLGWAAPKEASAASAEWLLNGKAIAHQSLAEQHILARDAKDPGARQLVDDLQNTRARLAALINRLPLPGLENEYQRDVQDLKVRENDLAQKLGRAVGRPHRAKRWIALEELRGKLGPKTAFVDIARFTLFDFDASKVKRARYVAWITPPRGMGDVQLIDLGEAEPIDLLVAQTRKTLLDSAKAITKVGEIEATAALQQPLKDLSAKVLNPLLPALAKYEEWIVCPDGALWLTPWNALLLPTPPTPPLGKGGMGGVFAIEKHLIRHVVSGRDLVLELPTPPSPPQAGGKGGAAYIFADPDYDLSPTKVMAASGLRGLTSPLLGQRLRGSIGAWNVSFEFLDQEVVIYDDDSKGSVAGKGTWKDDAGALTIQTGISRFQGTRADDEIRGQRSMRNPNGSVTRDTFRINLPNEETRSMNTAAKTLPRVPRLPGTAGEAEAIRPKLQQWLGQKPKVFLEEKASEAMVRAVKNPRVLTLATHGYFLPRAEVEVKDKSTSIENPLLRCGLLLAGCNKRGEAKAGEDDGILTGLEIVGLDLNGCELVVLSACETGLGDVRNGEGVAGLRQAFQLAGAKSVLASLWQVPDRETALLMNAFYGELTKGTSQAEALRQAQLQRIAAQRAGFGAAHPFFWSAFALTSRGKD